MSSFISLVKAFTKQGEMSQPMDKKKKRKIAVLSIFSVCFIFLPVLVLVGLFVKYMTESLMLIDSATMGIQLMLHVICFFSVIFGINVVFSEFYFANDIEFLLPWPIRGWHIVGAKFVSVFLMENVMQLLFVVSCVVGYGAAVRMGIGEWILSILGILTLPILPLVYCGILAIVLMSVTGFIPSKDGIQKASMIFLFAMIILLVASIGKLQNMDIGMLIERMVGGDKNFLQVMDFVFPNVPLFVRTFAQGSVIALVEYILINAVAIAVMLGIAEVLYFKSITKLNSSATNHKTKSIEKLLASAKQRSGLYAYFIKEIRILLRTPAFFTNCIAINFIWPVFVYAVIKMSGNGFTLSQVQESYAQNDIVTQLIFLLGVVGISVLLSALNSISSSSFSREGKHFSFMKYIPLSYEAQWNVKVMVAVMFSILGVLIFYVPVSLLVHMPLWHMIIFILLSLLSVLFVSYMGAYIDSIQPKLIWDDEMNSLRGNANCFFSMAIAIAFVAVVCLGGFFLFRKLQWSIQMVSFILFGILAAANLIVLTATVKSGSKHIQQQEET